MEFKLHAPYEPTGDQPKAIEKLVKGFKEGNQFETLLGVTGSGKTFTMANVIQALNKPTLIISHNKTLAGQLYGEMKEFFPENAVEYFVSYYDYYQPEAYVPQSDTYIAKDSAVNDEIDKLRLSATAALAERKDVIIVASVSCIYGIGSPDDYMNMMVSLRPGMEIDRDDVIKGLIDMQYTRNEMDFKRGTFRVHGDVLEIFPANNTDTAIRVEFFGDEIDRITEVDVLTGEIKCILKHAAVFPASHYVVPQEKMNAACDRIEAELEERVRYFKGEDKLLEAQRIAERTNFDIEMMKETGFCSGIENYSRHLAGRAEGEMPETLMDYFPDDFLIIVDESHITIPQVRGMYAGDRSRKQTLVDYGFRLPSALDNRPLNFEEFESKIDQMLFVSATPNVYENEHELLRVEQIIRPTGLLDPEISVRPVEGHAAEKDDFGVLAAQFDDRVGVGYVLVDGGGGGVHLLHEVDLRRLGHAQAGRAGDDDAHLPAGEPVRQRAQSLGGPLPGLGVVPLIGAEQQFVLFVQQHHLDSGGANINANTKAHSVHLISFIRIRTVHNISKFDFLQPQSGEIQDVP